MQKHRIRAVLTAIRVAYRRIGRPNRQFRSDRTQVFLTFSLAVNVSALVLQLAEQLD